MRYCTLRSDIINKWITANTTYPSRSSMKHERIFAASAIFVDPPSKSPGFLSSFMLVNFFFGSCRVFFFSLYLLIWLGLLVSRDYLLVLQLHCTQAPLLISNGTPHAAMFGLLAAMANGSASLLSICPCEWCDMTRCVRDIILPLPGS